MVIKIGDRIILNGTKAGNSYDWNTFFGNFGIVKGDLATIKEIEGGYYFVKTDKQRPNDNGFLLECDFILKPNNLKDFLSQSL